MKQWPGFPVVPLDQLIPAQFKQIWYRPFFYKFSNFSSSGGALLFKEGQTYTSTIKKKKKMETVGQVEQL